MPWNEPGPTPAGLIEMNGMSPRPTEAPGPEGVPHELRKRAMYSVVFSPTPSMCGWYYSGISCELNVHTFGIMAYLTRRG